MKKRNITNLRWFNRLLRWTFGRWLQSAYVLRAEGTELFKTLRPPYVLVANHVTTRDPFFLSIYIPQPVYWISSDSNMRTSVMRWLLRLVGTIPKSKVIPDIETVNEIVQVIRRQKGVVGLFPEGAQSWNGGPLPMFPSTGKLLKLLKVPVVGATISGGYFALPRWTWKRRHGQVRIKFQQLFSAADCETLSAEDLFTVMRTALSHDDFDDPDLAGIPYRSGKRAEHLELALYLCPDCESLGGLRSRGNHLYCTVCGSAWSVDAHYRICTRSTHNRTFASIPEWDAWQSRTLLALLQQQVEGDKNARTGNEGVETKDQSEKSFSRPVFSDPGALLLRGYRSKALRQIRTGTLVLYPDRLELATILGQRLVFPLNELDGITVLKRNLLEFYQGKNLYQVRFPFRYMSARKWADSMEALQKIL
ncbi:MAG: lysophospholipid acyltransferase family protein [Termitinemataceae bacterium]